MHFSISRDPGIKLLALYLLFVVPKVISLLIFDKLTSKQLESDVKTADLALARAIGQETNTFLDNALLAVRQIAVDPFPTTELFYGSFPAQPF